MGAYLTVLQIAAPAAAAAGLVLAFSPAGLVVSIALFVLMGGLGMHLTYHMALAHRRPMNRALRMAGMILSFLGSHMSPVEWSLRHTAHHRYVDAEGDPHCPARLGWKAAFFFFHGNEGRLPPVTAGRVMADRQAVFVHRFGWWFVVAHVSVCGAFGIEGLVYGFALPVALTLWGQVAAVFNHGPEGPKTRGWINALVTMGEHRHAEHHGRTP